MAELSPEAFGFKPAGKSTKELDPSAFGFGSPTTEAVTPTAADYLKGIASGVGSLASGVGYLAEVAGADQVGRAIRGIGDTTQRYWQESMTPAGQRDAQSRVFEDDPGAAVPVKLGDRWGQALAMGAAQSAPSMLAAAIPGGIAAAGLRGAAGMAASRGIGGALAPLAAGLAAPIGGWATNFAGNLAARVPTALGFGAAEGAVAGATNAAQWKSDIEQKPLAELRNMPGFAALESQVGEQAARQQIAEQGASDIMRNTTLATGGIGALTGGGALGSAFQRVTTGAKGWILGAIGRDAAKEAAQEIPQSGGERAIQNIATRDYLDPSQPITQGVLADALSGGAIGSVTGGVMGGGSHLSKGPLQKAAEASTATVPPTSSPNEGQGIPQSIPQSIPQEGGVPPAAGSTAGQTPAAVARADTSVLDVARAAAEDLETADTTSEGFRQTAEGLRKLPQQPNTPVAPGISPVPVSTAAPSLPSNQAESAGVPKPPQQGEKPSGPQAEIAQPAAPGQQAQPAAVFGAAGTVGNTGTQPAPVPANTGTQPVQAPANTGTQPAKAADSAEAEREWRDFVASEGRDIGPRQLAVIREQFMRRQMMNAAIEAATGRVEDARQREVAANRMAILDSLPLTITGNTIRRFAASLRDAGIRDSRVSPEERQLIARRIAARDTLQHLEQVPPNELTLPEKQVKQAQPTMPRIESLRRRAAMPGVRIVGNRMLDRHGKRLATLSDDEAAELLPKPKPAPARTVEDTELADFIKSESADLGKRRLTLRALQAIRRQKQAEADKTDLEDLIEAERADLRERFARLLDAQAAARAKKPFVIPPLTTPAQPTTTSVLSQQATEMPVGRFGVAAQKQQPESRYVSQVPPSELVKVRTIDGATVRVRKSDLAGDRPRLQMFKPDGSRASAPFILRENLDPDGSKQKASNAEFVPDIIPDRNGHAFKSQLAARRAASQRGVKDTHDVVPASEVSPGATGFVLRKKPEQKSPARLPPGWTEASPGGIATNKDERTGGIVDVSADGTWFAVANAEGIPTLAGFKSRDDAFAALAAAVERNVRASSPNVSADISPDISGGATESQQPKQTVRQRLLDHARRIGVYVDAGGSTRFFSGNGRVVVPAEDAQVEGAQSADHVFAHELGHATLQKRGLSFDRMPVSQLVRWMPEWKDVRNASKEFRPGVWNHANDRIRRHARTPNEIVADAIASVLLGINDVSLLRKIYAIEPHDAGFSVSSTKDISPDIAAPQQPSPAEVQPEIGKDIAAAQQPQDQHIEGKSAEPASDAKISYDEASPTRKDGNDPANAPTEKPESSPDDMEKLQAARQLLADNIETKRLNRQTVPTAWTTKLAEVDAKIRGESDPEAVYSMVVEGHPMFDGSPMLRNLIPIKVTSLAAAERKLFAAQDLYSKISGDRAKAKYALSIAKTAQQKKDAQKALHDLNNIGATEDAVDTLRQETLPELQRLVNAAEDKFGSAKPAPESAQTEPTSNASELPAAEASTDNTQAAEPLKKPEELPAREATSDTSAATKIDDFGEKLEGARKDYATQLKDAMDVDVASEPLSKSWPEPDYQKLLDGGAAPYMVAFVRAARDELPTKPQKGWKLAGWVKQAEMLRDMAQKLLSGNISASRVKEMLQEDRFKVVRDSVGNRAELYEIVGHGRSLKGVTFAHHFFSLYKGQENVSKWVVEQRAKATAFSNWPRELAVGDTKDEALAAFKEKFASLDLGSNAKRQPQFVVYRKRGETGAWIGKKIGREYIDLHKTADVAEARKYMAENLSALEAKLARYKETPFERKPENQPRVGDDHRNGAPVTPDVFAETFGFRGVQFGNYVEQGRRQSDLNEAFDGLMDLAAVLGVPPRALSLNGRLGLAFGSRGRGGRNAPAAHFEPDRVVINLTKGGGPGSLAHEWWHSLDNYFAKQSNDKSAGFVTSGAGTNSMRDALRASFNAVKLATSTDAYRRRSAELDKRRSKPYWNMPEERSARAFEGYVIAKLFDQGAANDYLANVVSNEVWDITENARSEFFGGGESPKTYPYPTVDEMPVVRAAFDEFFKTVETKAGEDGNVVLYSGASSQAASPSDRAIFSMAAEGKSAEEILSFISKASRRPFNRVLAAALRRAGVVSSITLDTASRFGKQQGAARYAAAYNARTDTVALFTYRDAERHVLHELVHAATMKAIAGKGPAAVRMRALFRHVQKSGSLDGQYGMSNVDEFVAEAFSNPRFQDALKGIPAPKGSTLTSAWQWFVRIVARIAGIKTQPLETALDQALTVGAQLMRENAALVAGMDAVGDTRYSDAVHPFDGREVAATPLKPGATTINVDGTERPALNGVDRYYPSQTLSDVVLARQSAMSKSRPYGNPGDSERISDLLIGRSFSLHGLGGLDVPAQREVLNSVVALGNDKEVVRSVVEFIPVDVMNVLRRENGSAESIFSDKTVLKKFLSADGNGSVATAIDIADALVAGIARVAAKRPIPGWLVPGRLGKGNSATGANVSDEAHFSTVPQIKATGNTGAFSPTDPDIRFNLATDWQQSPVAQEVAKAFSAAAKSDAALSWLNPVQTQYHKAERLAQQGKFGFKRVFDIGQRFLSDISRFAVMAENSAPTLFHQIRSIADAKQAAGAALRGDFGQQRNADIRAIAAPLYEGTLYGGGNPMAGMVWSDAQLRSRFGLTDRQIVLYHEAREAVKVSMDEMAKSLIARHAKREKMAADTSGSLQDVAEGVRDTLTLRADVLADEAKAKHDDTMQQVEDLRNAGGQDRRAKDMQKEADAKLDSQKAEVARIRATVEDVQAIADKAQKLQDAGYFPLMRFGRHTVTARDAAGKVKHFSMHDGIPLVPRSGQAQANRLADALREEHPDWDVTTGLMNPEKYKLYQGMNVDALQLFADHLDDETRQTYQEIIRLATNERAALRRMLTREGTPGFDRDVRRTLASFILSNARYTSSAYHLADMAKAAEQAEEDGGDVGAEAVKLYDYVTKPQEEAAKLRGFLFFNFLGGSLAAAMVNATQVPMMTFPRLAQYEDAGKLAARLARAAKVAVQNPADVTGDVGDALRRAEEDGITAPHQIYEMTATAANNVFSGSRAGSAILRAWGAPFALAESFNRRTTFVAAFQIGRGMTVNQLRDAGVSTAFEFAEKVVQETQGIYNRGNRVNIGRGAIRATVMTFRQFSIMYLEMFSRLPPKQKAIMAGMLILAAGAGGLPFAEDIEDIIDTIGQWLGYRTNTRRTIRRGLSSFAGQRAADIAMNGVLSQMGADLHSRLGLHNIWPGTALLKPSTTDKGREFQDLLGPAASVVAAMGQALQDLATGRPDKAALAMAPVAVQNAVKGIKMAATGRAEDARGKPTIPVSLSEAGAKAVGFNPKSVADYGAVKRASTQDDRLLDVMRERFTSAIVDAIVANDQEAKDEAFRQVLEWNRRNPDARIDPNPAAIRKRVMDMRADGPSRVLKSLSPSLRQQARQEFANAQ